MDADIYLVVRSLHIISFTMWMAGMFYLPRLYVYHCAAKVGGELDTTLQLMERRLLRYIVNPAMILTFIFGIWLANMTEAWSGGWFHAKMLLLAAMATFHGMLARWRKYFASGTNKNTARFYRWVNEIPTILLIGIVFLAVLKPF